MYKKKNKFDYKKLKNLSKYIIIILLTIIMTFIYSLFITNLF